jgi:LDH2 family malate/lactate/ureidoglycolate dehydrogenase
MEVARAALVATVKCEEADVDEVAWDVVDAAAEAAAATSVAATLVASSGQGVNSTGILVLTRVV